MRKERLVLLLLLRRQEERRRSEDGAPLIIARDTIVYKEWGVIQNILDIANVS